MLVRAIEPVISELALDIKRLPEYPDHCCGSHSFILQLCVQIPASLYHCRRLLYYYWKYYSRAHKASSILPSHSDNIPLGAMNEALVSRTHTSVPPKHKHLLLHNSKCYIIISRRLPYRLVTKRARSSLCSHINGPWWASEWQALNTLISRTTSPLTLNVYLYTSLWPKC